MTTEDSNRTSPLAAPHDIGAARLAKVYAQAIVEAADRHECQAEVVEELTHVVEEVLPRVDSLTSVLESPQVTTSDKTAIVSRTFSGKISTTALNALLVLASHERLGLLPELVSCSTERVRPEGRETRSCSYNCKPYYPRRTGYDSQVSRRITWGITYRSFFRQSRSARRPRRSDRRYRLRSFRLHELSVARGAFEAEEYS